MGPGEKLGDNNRHCGWAFESLRSQHWGVSLACHRDNCVPENMKRGFSEFTRVGKCERVNHSYLCVRPQGRIHYKTLVWSESGPYEKTVQMETVHSYGDLK